MRRGLVVAAAALLVACRPGAPPTSPALSGDIVELPRAAFGHIHIEQLATRARTRGAGIGGQITAAASGNRDALDSVLAAASWIGVDSLHPIPAYPMVLQGLLETVGDAMFNTSLLHLTSTARYYALRELRTAGLMEKQRFVLVWATDSTVARSVFQPRPPRGVEDTTTVQRVPAIIRGSCTPPQFPRALQRIGWNGRVMVDFVIGANGIPERPTIRAAASTHPLLEPEAIKVALSCRYQPGLIAGRPVRVRVQQPVNFVFGVYRR